MNSTQRCLKFVMYMSRILTAILSFQAPCSNTLFASHTVGLAVIVINIQNIFFTE